MPDEDGVTVFVAHPATAEDLIRLLVRATARRQDLELLAMAEAKGGFLVRLMKGGNPTG
ncbi:hypothetical protein [Glutamicibacter sp. V16R2B1]|uniref:hypothetical protein n=1 Tax=Glutamicibacter sp. V16R2B1 TaxID=2036207 RepID=UPI0014854A40|nr:hypothetical protein [Glutamicibacter sp. V16R2B1]